MFLLRFVQMRWTTCRRKWNWRASKTIGKNSIQPQHCILTCELLYSCIFILDDMTERKMLYRTQIFVAVIHLLTTFYNARKYFIHILNVQRSNAVYIVTSLNKFIWKFMKKKLRIGWIRQDKRKRSMSIWKVFSTKQRPEINVENVITKRLQGP